MMHTGAFTLHKQQTNANVLVTVDASYQLWTMLVSERITNVSCIGKKDDKLEYA